MWMNNRYKRHKAVKMLHINTFLTWFYKTRAEFSNKYHNCCASQIWSLSSCHEAVFNKYSASTEWSVNEERQRQVSHLRRETQSGVTETLVCCKIVSLQQMTTGSLARMIDRCEAAALFLLLRPTDSSSLHPDGVMNGRPWRSPLFFYAPSLLLVSRRSSCPTFQLFILMFCCLLLLLLYTWWFSSVSLLRSRRDSGDRSEVWAWKQKEKTGAERQREWREDKELRGWNEGVLKLVKRRKWSNSQREQRIERGEWRGDQNRPLSVSLSQIDQAFSRRGLCF